MLIQKFHELEFVRFATLREATLNNLVTLELSGLTLGVTDTAVSLFFVCAFVCVCVYECVCVCNT